MARINIEDSLFRDSRFLKLILKLGCQYKALGLVTSAWILSQQTWIRYKRIPSKAWSDELDVLIEVGLAQRLDDGSIYIKGSKTAFLWLEQKSKAGQKGGKKRAENQAGVKRASSGASRLQASYSYSYSSSSSNSNSNSSSNNNNNHETKNEGPAESANAVQAVVKSKVNNKFLLKVTASKEVSINRELLASWQDQYPKEFLELSLKEMRSWLLANEHKAPKSAWGRFINNWFARGYERYRKTLNSQPAKVTLEEFEEIMKREAFT